MLDIDAAGSPDTLAAYGRKCENTPAGHEAPRRAPPKRSGAFPVEREAPMATLEATAYAEITEALAHLAHDAARLPAHDPRWTAKHAKIDALLDHLDTLAEP